MLKQPMDLWMSPSERSEPFGTYGQTDGQRFALTTACPHSLTSQPQSHRLNNKFFYLGWRLRATYLKSCLKNRTISVLPKPDILACY